MGQYHRTFNLDKREQLYPHAFGDGLKLMEFGGSSQGLMTGLAILLASSCKGGARGGGDVHSSDPLVGSWAGDRIAIVGDYSEDGDLPDGWPTYGEMRESFTDISDRVVKLMREAGEGR